jgi:hypothetical protein
LHAIGGSPPRRPPQTLVSQGFAAAQEGWRVVVRVGS